MEMRIVIICSNNICICKKTSLASDWLAVTKLLVQLTRLVANRSQSDDRERPRKSEIVSSHHPVTSSPCSSL